ncbi:hypothetical protein [Massilia sp. CCM 8734]|uniref:DUF7674 family protein n=1 Tax=Massilia sp. CCM 8734 TaxID=2609283 RepID=UPI001422DF71|nr:hypothetical protein [Massilia sp. CCM 8734]NHZ95969.1 hypothetical protein [Massilia sp. CCM 8734]
MNLYIDENRLVSSIRVRFPEEAALTEQRLAGQGLDPAERNEFPHMWVEAFADRITQAIKRRDIAAIRAQTGFLAEQYRAAPDALRSIVDVSYAENIMWDASDEEKAWAWEFIAADIRQLYEQMWRKPTA